MKAVGYIRVSSEMQVRQGHGLDVQRQMITNYVYSKGWILSDLFCETAHTGRLTDRPALKMLLARARHGEFDVIVVTSFDRFHRDLLHLLLALDQLRQWNVSFVSITENIDFTTPGGKVALAVHGFLIWRRTQSAMGCWRSRAFSATRSARLRVRSAVVLSIIE